ncbi:heteromeric transposase endonuclease subunit TnsA [Scytonema sp. UIC 10036]|uniref:TnsA endonuclease N-terminal domain-containing protein n=1 Tax=Scytonema sp. UIC 10036 TaxID=2304196 RepID=UPI0012DA4DC1|nr:TnsA endonuclease N-terminal domain-containing protein [Scytonema sp. UIC 10036]MUG91691.1 heteromeric transposase endonuclease subunit TnsA [Scytonema sp. UIC 10036]
MAHSTHSTTSSVIEKRLKQGRGQGRGADYKPWLTIQDVSSIGLSKRILGITTRRRHEFFSQIESNYFYILDWAKNVTDIREQYPMLPLSETLEIAANIGVAHPILPKTKEPIVMTTDFYIEVQQNLGVCYQARTVKPENQLDDKRTIEKLEIERQYWERRNISWGIVTEHDIPLEVVKNLKWIRVGVDWDALGLSKDSVKQAKKLLSQYLTQSQDTLTDICSRCDVEHGLKTGGSLAIVRNMLQTRELIVDLHQPIHSRKKLIIIKTQF